MKKERPKLGTWHTITEHAWKDNEKGIVKWRSDPIKEGRMQWNAETQHHEYISEPTTSYLALYVGYRHKFNGHWEDGGYEEMDYFVQDETVEVWMFVTHANRNPIPVFPFEIPETPGITICTD